MIEIGEKAPSFTLKKGGGGTVSLAEFKGKWVVLYFYPKDLTPGCTSQAIDFTNKAVEFENLNTVIIGISPDTVSMHDKFIAKHKLTIILAADEERRTIESYDVWKEKKMYGKTYMGVERSTFLVDRNGIINAIWRRVKVPGSTERLLDSIKTNQNIK